MPFVKPAVDMVDGAEVVRVVRDPIDLSPLPAEGREVPATSFWMRRLRDGDVIAAGTAGPDPEPASSKPTRARRD
jgi:hypothetical protein